MNPRDKTRLFFTTKKNLFYYKENMCVCYTKKACRNANNDVKLLCIYVAAFFELQKRYKNKIVSRFINDFWNSKAYPIKSNQ